MDTETIAEYYADLLITQYRDKTKARAMVKATILPMLMDQLPVAVQDAFSIDEAEGVQLDVLGKYVGASRYTYTPTNPITLDDDDFRTLIRMIIIKNNNGSSLQTIQNLLAMAFPGQVYVSDNQSMGLNYLILDSLGTPDLLDAIIYGDYLPRPMGVQSSATIVGSITKNFFGFRTYSAPGTNVSPFNFYANYQLNYPWLSYFS